MNRRNFFKTVAGLSLGIAGTQLAFPYSIKARMAKPVADWVANAFLDPRIKDKISKLKRKNPDLRIGDTHCHSLYSDGNSPVADLLDRAAALGLDFLVITEHLMPRQYPLHRCLASIQERLRCVREWENPSYDPVTVYPALEISTLQGHLIVVLDPEFLHPRKFHELKLQFSRFDQRMISMEDTAQLVEPFGGITIIPHPGIHRDYPFGASLDFIRDHLVGQVDAIEDVSTGHGYEEDYSTDLGMAAVGSSDDHFNLIIGTAVTGYDSRRHRDFLSAIKDRETQAIKVDRSVDDLMAAARLVL
ncbi:MAG: PHP domain-containing protein [Nitrospinaceae bacterium]